MNKIKTFSEACKVLGLDEKTIVPDHSAFPEEDRKAMDAHAQLVIMTKAQNEGLQGDAIYYPVFWKNAPSGGGFRFYGADNWGTGSNVGSRLCFKTRAAAEWAGENWTELYEVYHMPAPCEV